MAGDGRVPNKLGGCVIIKPVEPKSLLNLNQEQREAVVHTDGPILIVAGPGSGKTRVLAHKVAYLIERNKAQLDELLTVTFTNKAAGEMRERVNRLLGNQVTRKARSRSPNYPVTQLPNMWIGTFHATCAKILRRDGSAIGIPPSFVIYDVNNQQTLVKKVMEKLNLQRERLGPAGAVAAISKAKCELLSSEDYASRTLGDFQRAIAMIYAEYQKALRRGSALDFGDLIAEAVRLFRERPTILEHWRERFRYILVDEYQDTNHAQYAFIKLLSAKHQNICAVGDMAQAIYSWRGADFRNILRFERDFPQAKVFRLSRNYRSTKTILSAAKNLIEKNWTHVPLDLWTENREGKPIVLYEAENELDEAAYVSQIITAQLPVCRSTEEPRTLCSSKGAGEESASPRQAINHQYRNFAVLYRTNAQSRVIEEVFIRAGIPYILVGGVKFYERREIKDVLAYLRLLLNPGDAISRERVIKIGKGRFKAFQELLGDERLSAQPPIQILDAVLEKTGYLDYLDNGTEEGLSRIDNVKELRSVATSFELLSEFLEHVSLVDLNDSLKLSGRLRPRRIRSSGHRNAVTLMTLHAAKGLEFPVVFIVGMEEGLLPHSRSMDTRDELEEERRLTYVGLTRAKEELHLTYAKERLFFGSRSQALPSRFLSEIGEEHFLYHLS